jgi:hypothetical protein
MNEIVPRRPAELARRMRLAFLCAAIAAACAGSTGGGFGVTRDASNEGRRALDIECIGSLAFSPDTSTLAASDGRVLRVRKSPSGRPIESIEVREGASQPSGTCIAYSPDGRWLACSCKGELAVKLVDTRDWKEKATYSTEPERVGALTFSNDSSEMALGTAASRIELVTLDGGARRVLRKSLAGTSRDPAPITFLAYGQADRELLANAGADAIAIDRAQGDVLWSRGAEQLLAVARDARRVVSASSKTGVAVLLDVAGAAEPSIACTFQDPAGPGAATHAVFAPDDAWIGVCYTRHFAGTNWQDLEFFRVTADKLRKPASPGAGENLLARHIRGLRAGEPRRVSISPDGKLLCLCTVPIAGIYEVNRLISESDLRD